MKIWTDLSSVLPGITRVTDGRTDRQTDGRTDGQNSPRYTASALHAARKNVPFDGIANYGEKPLKLDV